MDGFGLGCGCVAGHLGGVAGLVAAREPPAWPLPQGR